MLLEKIHEIKKECMGCTACANVCPVTAIQMLPDEDGFIKPAVDEEKCIHCEKCENHCPQLNYISDNEKEPPCYAVKMSDDVLEKSSSGGAFTALANYVFDRNGYVCGAAYDEDFRGVSQIMISDREELYKLRGSKYVYCKPGDIYRQVLEKLEEGAYVLFSGSPCQVAALKAYLPKDFERLITVDLLCGGYPPEKLFRQYVDDVAQGREIKNISFRPKRYGWDYSGILFEFVNGEEYIIHSVRDPYLRAFSRFMITNPACDDCKFAPAARVGDFTIGDFWNYNRYDYSVDLKKGISCLLTNNRKSMEIFDEIKDSFAFVNKVPVSFLRRFNRVHEKRKPFLAQKRFFSLIREGWEFGKAVDYALNWKFDVAVTGCWTVPNYGGELTYYALYKIIKDMGYSVIMVERRTDIPGYDVPVPTAFEKNPYPFYDVSRIHKNFVDQAELNARVNTFVLGSDQVWNYNLMEEESIKSWSLDYVGNYRRKISYSTSFGTNPPSATPKQLETLSGLVRKFNAVSVREKSGVGICEQMGVAADWVLDPVLLVDKDHFQKLMDVSRCQVPKNYVCSYFIFPNQKYDIEKICNALEMGHIFTIGFGMEKRKEGKGKFDKKNCPYPYMDNLSLEGWLKYLTNSSFIITDSFHATCLAIKYHIPFVFIKGFMDERLQTVLETVGLMDRIAKTVNDAFETKIYLKEIDWEQVDMKLEPEIERSRKWLEEALKVDIVQ